MKVVMIVNKDLPLGLIANTTAVLGMSLGNMRAEIIGDDITDASGHSHKGITNMTIPVLAGDRDSIRELHERARAEDAIEIIGFSEIAQSIHSYEEYEKALSASPTEKIDFSGICLLGDKSRINSLTGQLPLLR